jgi:transmembrane 9 superfamily protein 3
MQSNLFLLFPLILLAFVHAEEYQYNSPVILWENKVGPRDNPQEFYEYDSLPICGLSAQQGHKQEKRESLGEALQGYELVDSGIKFKFNVPEDNVIMCNFVMTEKEVNELSYAIKNNYYFELFLDDLPVWGEVGTIGQDIKNKHLDPYIFTHRKYSISYNNNHIIHVNLTQLGESIVVVKPGVNATLTYSVSWISTNTPYEHRFYRYLDNQFFENKIHWFAIFNSFMMVIFLVILVFIILMRTLRKDIASYNLREDVLEKLIFLWFNFRTMILAMNLVGNYYMEMYLGLHLILEFSHPSLALELNC